MTEIFKIICIKSNFYEDGAPSVTQGNEYDVVAEYIDMKGTGHYVILDDQGNENHFTVGNEFFNYSGGQENI